MEVSSSFKLYFETKLFVRCLEVSVNGGATVFHFINCSREIYPSEYNLISTIQREKYSFCSPSARLTVSDQFLCSLFQFVLAKHGTTLNRHPNHSKPAKSLCFLVSSTFLDFCRDKYANLSLYRFHKSLVILLNDLEFRRMHFWQASKLTFSKSEQTCRQIRIRHMCCRRPKSVKKGKSILVKK